MTTRRRPGLAVVSLAAGTATRRCRSTGAALVLVALAGRATVLVDGAATELAEGDAAVCPAGRSWAVRTAVPARLMAVGVPAGPEAVLRTLAGPAGWTDAALVALAADAGVELLLDPLGP